jgi:hypothetical protein
VSYLAGKLSSEYKKALRAEATGLALIVLGAALGGYGSLGEHTAAGLVGLGLAAIGAYVLAASLTSYAAARGAVKAAAAGRTKPGDTTKKV